VRNITNGWKVGLTTYAEHLESLGHQVYFPLKNTKQNSSELEICEENRLAIMDADEVHMAWDGKSEGCLFDFGMAFALQKKIMPIDNFIIRTGANEKSFINLLYDGL